MVGISKMTIPRGCNLHQYHHCSSQSPETNRSWLLLRALTFTCAIALFLWVDFGSVPIFNKLDDGTAIRKSDSSKGNQSTFDGKLNVTSHIFDDSCTIALIAKKQNEPISSIDSIFNCNRPGSTCKYYYPVNFFHPTCGIGRKFRNIIIDETERKRKNMTLWNDMPSIGFPTIRVNTPPLDDPEKQQSLQSTPRIGEHLSFIHVHKSGGTSLHEAFNKLAGANKHITLTRHHWFFPSRSKQIIRPSNMPTSMINRTLLDLRHAITYPPSLPFQYDEHLIFAVVRDPVERFISSLGQAMGASGSAGEAASALAKQCIKETRKETLQCVIDYVKVNSIFVELHFSPQVLDISFATMWQDIPIAVFPFQELPNILTYLGIRSDTKKRDGSAMNYRPYPILTNMSVADYDENMIRDVCTIYEVDVIMQRSLGLQVRSCDPFIPSL